MQAEVYHCADWGGSYLARLIRLDENKINTQSWLVTEKETSRLADRVASSRDDSIAVLGPNPKVPHLDLGCGKALVIFVKGSGSTCSGCMEYFT